LTRNEKYLDFARYIVSRGATSKTNLFELAYEGKLAPYQFPVTKAYEMISNFEGLLEYYRATGEEKWKIACINLADKIAETDITIDSTLAPQPQARIATANLPIVWCAHGLHVCSLYLIECICR
jgi:hypothetical protein